MPNKTIFFGCAVFQFDASTKTTGLELQGAWTTNVRERERVIENIGRLDRVRMFKMEDKVVRVPESSFVYSSGKFSRL